MNKMASSKVAREDDVAYLILRTSLQQYEKSPKELSDEQLAGIKRQASKEYDLQNRVLASPEARDVIVPESVVDSTFHEIQNRYQDRNEFLQDLEQNGMTESRMRAALARELKVETVLDRVGSRSVSVSDMDIMIYYHMHIDRFEQPETRTVRHILITINEDFEENTKDSARQRLEKIRDRLQKKPKRFEEQAMKHSECPTALRGGLIGRIPRGQLYSQLDEKLFAMKEGELSEVVESPSGFHLLMCESIHSQGPASLKEARPKIQELLEKRARRMCQKAWLAELLNSEK
jgi:nitrogen fixation protein NifM